MRVTWITGCISEKRGYQTRRQANRARRNSARKFREPLGAWDIYTCPVCEYYHIGHSWVKT